MPLHKIVRYLSQNPTVQLKLRDEILTAFGATRDITYDDLVKPPACQSAVPSPQLRRKTLTHIRL